MPGASPTSSTTDLHDGAASGNSYPDGGSDGAAAFPPFKASHLHADLRLALGYLASTIIIAVSAWSYLVEKDWQKNKGWTAVAVVA